MQNEDFSSLTTFLSDWYQAGQTARANHHRRRMLLLIAHSLSGQFIYTTCLLCCFLLVMFQLGFQVFQDWVFDTPVKAGGHWLKTALSQFQMWNSILYYQNCQNVLKIWKGEKPHKFPIMDSYFIFFCILFLYTQGKSLKQNKKVGQLQTACCIRKMHQAASLNSRNQNNYKSRCACNTFFSSLISNFFNSTHFCQLAYVYTEYVHVNAYSHMWLYALYQSFTMF